MRRKEKIGIVREKGKKENEKERKGKERRNTDALVSIVVSQPCIESTRVNGDVFINEISASVKSHSNRANNLIN